jgi:predicted amidohydrolase
VSGTAPDGGVLRLGLVQMNSAPQAREENVRKALRLVGEVAQAGAELVVLPEFFNTEYFFQYRDTAYLDNAEPEAGPTISAMRGAAREHGITICATILEEDGPGVHYDTAFLIEPSGEVAGKYRKVHPGGSMSLEKLYFRGGGAFPTWRVKDFRVGAIICYDHFFPEAARAVAIGGAEVILGPFAAPGVALPWEAIMITRAFENGVYLAPCNKVGREGDWTFGGDSMVVSPRGEVLARASTDAEATLVVELRRDEVHAARRRYPMMRDRRPDVYGAISSADEVARGLRT